MSEPDHGVLDDDIESPAEPRRRYWGGDLRSMANAVRAEIPVGERTAVSTVVNHRRNQALLRVGNAEIYGKREDMRVLVAAISGAIDELEGVENKKREREAASAQTSICPECHAMHAPGEPHAIHGLETRQAAYDVLGRSYLFSRGQPELLADSAALWIKAGDVASARSLLDMWVPTEMAHETVDALIRILDREEQDA